MIVTVPPAAGEGLVDAVYVLADKLLTTVLAIASAFCVAVVVPLAVRLYVEPNDTFNVIELVVLAAAGLPNVVVVFAAQVTTPFDVLIVAPFPAVIEADVTVNVMFVI